MNVAIQGFSDQEYNNEIQDIEKRFSPGGAVFERKKEEYKRRRGLKIARSFYGSKEFRRLNKSRYQALARLDNRFATERANQVISGDLSNLKDYNKWFEGPYWMVGKGGASANGGLGPLAVWDMVQSSVVKNDIYGIVLIEGEYARVYKSRMTFNIGLTRVNSQGKAWQRDDDSSDRPISIVEEADDGFNNYVIIRLIR